MKISFLFIMLFLHVVADYNLQGILAQLKQQDWWKTNAPARLYKNDYIVALICHSFSWSFLVMLPWLVYAMINGNNIYYWHLFILYILNTLIHARVDDLKANKHYINLIEDQLLHLGQIIISYLWMILL